MKSERLTLGGSLACLAAPGKFHAAPALAQVIRAAIVRIIDEKGRSPYVPFRARGSQFELGIFEFALLVAIFVGIAHIKGRPSRNQAAPADSFFCDPRIIILVDDSPRDRVTAWSKNEGAPEPYGLDVSKNNCTSRRKKREQLDKQ